MRIERRPNRLAWGWIFVTYFHCEIHGQDAHAANMRESRNRGRCVQKFYISVPFITLKHFEWAVTCQF